MDCQLLANVARLSLTLVRPTQPVEIFGNTPFGTLAIRPIEGYISETVKDRR